MAPSNRLGMAAIHNCHVDPGFAGRLGRAQLRPHAPCAQLSFAVAEIFHRRRQLAHDA